MTHVLDLASAVAVIGLAVFSISALFALGLGLTFGRIAAAADVDMLDAYLRETYGVPEPDAFDAAARKWISDAREAA